MPPEAGLANWAERLIMSKYNEGGYIPEMKHVHGQPFADGDMVFEQVGWLDQTTGQFYPLNASPLPDKTDGTIRAVYVANGRHYRDAWAEACG